MSKYTDEDVAKAEELYRESLDFGRSTKFQLQVSADHTLRRMVEVPLTVEDFLQQAHRLNSRKS